jgi:hypothetical protein
LTKICPQRRARDERGHKGFHAAHWGCCLFVRGADKRGAGGESGAVGEGQIEASTWQCDYRVAKDVILDSANNTTRASSLGN